MRGDFVVIILTDIILLVLAEGPDWVKPQNTLVILDPDTPNACNKVVELVAKSTNGQTVIYGLEAQDPDGKFKIGDDLMSGNKVLQCKLSSITEPVYTVQVRAQHQESKEYSDKTLTITVAGLSTTKPDIDECATDPCQNEGVSTDLVDSYNIGIHVLACVTTCPNPNINECATDPCQNEGICTDLVNSYNCTCKPGFDGTNCQTNIDECATDPCQNEGVCTDLVDSYNCTCKPGFDGTNCQTNTDECRNNPCLNGGTCVDGNNSYTCNCIPGFEGSDCEKNIDECATDPCQNEGSCTDLVDSYNCTCKPGFDGTNCQTNTDECRNNPCLNGGTCVDGNNSYTCNCIPGFEGSDCEKKDSNTDRLKGQCKCDDDEYWDGKKCVKKKDIYNYTPYIVIIVILVLVVVVLVIFLVWKKLMLKRRSGQFGVTSKDTALIPKNENKKYQNVAFVEDETETEKQVDMAICNEEVSAHSAANQENDKTVAKENKQTNSDTDVNDKEQDNAETSDEEVSTHSTANQENDKSVAKEMGQSSCDTDENDKEQDNAETNDRDAVKTDSTGKNGDEVVESDRENDNKEDEESKEKK